jgi:SUN domain-containing protein 1/2
MRKELDSKFNYTLNLMSNKLVDQAMQIESSKSAHEKEIKQMKSVLDELESRYTHTFNNLQEQLHKQKQVLEQQQQSMQLQNEITQSSVQNSFKNSLENEQISFKKIEEYINKTFYIYNADKTGMTDFASESVGGSILFTRCTETYQDNSRWFTVFDVPISRVSVSPRVVIQGSIQPGNCWSFKGSKGNLFIKLAAKITPKSFSLEHIPKELAITGRIDSAPQNFTVYVSCFIFVALHHGR